MTATIIVVCLRIVIAFLVADAATVYFALVLPEPFPWGIGLTLALLELFGPVFVSRTSGKGFGGSFAAIGVLLRVAAGLLLWPAFAWAFSRTFGPHPLELRAALGAIPAVAIGLAAAGHGQGREHVRLAAVIASVLIALAALVQALPAGRAAVAAGCVAVAVALFVARTAHVWPSGHVRILDSVTALVGFAALANLVIFFV